MDKTMKLIWVVILILLIGVIGIHESFAEQASGKPAWNTSGNKVCGDKLCSDAPKPCTEEDYQNVIPRLERGYRGPQLEILDIHGNVSEEIKIDNQIQFTHKYSNGMDCVESFVWIIQINDKKDNTTVFLGWVPGTLEPKENNNFSVSWIPKQEGTYSVGAFIWTSMDNPMSLTPPVSTTISVTEHVRDE